MSDETIETRKNRATLYRKIAAVTAAVTRIPKNGRNTFHNYKYATESDLTDGIRDLLEQHGLAFLPPTVLSHERIPLEGKGGPLTRVQMQFALACCETGETVTSILWADGQDAADKGFYKAYTGGVKYFLMKTFLVATGDDPEQDTPQPRNSGGAQFEQSRERAVQGAQPRPKPNAPAAQQPDKRAEMISRIRMHMRRAQDFGFSDPRALTIDLDALSDAALTEAGKEWKARADALAAKDAQSIAA